MADFRVVQNAYRNYKQRKAAAVSWSVSVRALVPMPSIKVPPVYIHACTSVSIAIGVRVHQQKSFLTYHP